MNEEKKAAPQTTMQDAVQQMLPNDLKKQFVLQKNSGTLGQEPGKPPTPEEPKIPTLDPNLIQKPMRTFESDLAEALRKKQGSVASISIAENKKKEDESRKVELAQALAKKTAEVVPQKASQLKASAPTRSTAIPGATISIPETLDKTNDSVNSEINEALRVVRPTSEVVAEQSRVPKPPIAEPIAPVNAINVPTSVSFEEPHHTHILKPIILTLASLFLIGAGVFVGYYYFVQLNAKKAVPLTNETIALPSLLPFDTQINIELARERGSQIVSRMYSEVNRRVIEPRTNLEVVFSEIKGGVTRPISGSDFMERLETEIPNVIARSITDRWMMGVYGEDNSRKTTFMALTTDFFQNAFAGMLIWEENGLADDLALILNYKDKAIKQDLTASSTIQTYFGIQGTYSDRVLRNRDVREFRNQYGELLFLYSFVNKETLIITTTESAFIALVDRIEKDSYVR